MKNLELIMVVFSIISGAITLGLIVLNLIGEEIERKSLVIMGTITSIFIFLAFILEVLNGI